MYCVTGAAPNTVWYGTPPVWLRLINWGFTSVHAGHLLAGFSADDAALGMLMDGLFCVMKLPQISALSASMMI